MTDDPLVRQPSRRKGQTRQTTHALAHPGFVSFLTCWGISNNTYVPCQSTEEL
jgi:hypothetical protein